jgi:thiol:disulfide interchange protein DsbD
VTVNNADDAALLKRFALFGPPGILFFDKQGNEIKTRVIGYQNPDTFLVTLNSVMQ